MCGYLINGSINQLGSLKCPYMQVLKQERDVPVSSLRFVKQVTKSKKQVLNYTNYVMKSEPLLVFLNTQLNI